MASNITLIFTRHEEVGACSVKALLQIIEQVKPDVIFEELSEQLYEEAYTWKTLRKLEINSISKYVSDRSVLHIPVDTYDRLKSYDEDQYKLGDKLTGGAGRESFELRNLLDQLEARVRVYGFNYLNGDKNDIAQNMLEAAKLNVLKKLNDSKLDQLYQEYHEISLKREDVILDNVYNYVKDEPCTTGLMFIGSGHRESIMRKIEERAETSGQIIEWRYYSDFNLE